jgi:hypothetical protein
VAEKETEKGLMHSFFGEELCNGCKGMLVVAFISPTQKDVSSFASAFSRLQKDADAEGEKLVQGAMAASRTPKSRAGSSFKNTPTAKSRSKKTKR